MTKKLGQLYMSTSRGGEICCRKNPPNIWWVPVTVNEKGEVFSVLKEGITKHEYQSEVDLLKKGEPRQHQFALPFGVKCDL